MSTTSITVTVNKTTSALPNGVSFASTSVLVTDNSGAALPVANLTGTESPPWTATFTGTSGSQEASALITDLDTNGQAIGTPITLNESGTGGQTQQFQASSGGTLTVTDNAGT